VHGAQASVGLAAWRRAFPEPVRPPSFRWPPGHLARLRARARRRLPLFGGKRQKRLTVRQLIEAALPSEVLLGAGPA
jgi:hypothetical protein